MQLFNHPRTLEDLGRTQERSKQIMSATIDAWRDSLPSPFALVCVLSSQINAADARRKEKEQKAAATRCYAYLAVLGAVGDALAHFVERPAAVRVVTQLTEKAVKRSAGEG
jgi:hypothetical protein